MKYSFRNDYSQIGHPIILNALLENADKVNVGYGFDDVTLRLEKTIQKIVNENVNIYLLAGGTQTNMIALSMMMKPYEAVIAAESGHINVHETGAVEGTGHRIITVPTENGKLKAADIENVLTAYNDVHMVKPKAVYISNSTEIGTIYYKEELAKLSEVCQKNNLYLFLDGARLPVALTAKSNDLTLEDVVKATDACYIGGTKNGMPLGEVLIIKNAKINDGFRYYLKHKGAMFSKTFVLSYMFEKYFEDNLYLKLAKNSNETAEYLRTQLIANNIEIVYPNDTNQIFVRLKNEIIDVLKNDYQFEMWEREKDYSVIRLVTSYSTTKKGCDLLIDDIKKLQ